LEEVAATVVTVELVTFNQQLQYQDTVADQGGEDKQAALVVTDVAAVMQVVAAVLAAMLLIGLAAAVLADILVEVAT
jgi:hypothetical protein